MYTNTAEECEHIFVSRTYTNIEDSEDTTGVYVCKKCGVERWHLEEEIE